MNLYDVLFLAIPANKDSVKAIETSISSLINFCMIWPVPDGQGTRINVSLLSFSLNCNKGDWKCLCHYHKKIESL